MPDSVVAFELGAAAICCLVEKSALRLARGLGGWEDPAGFTGNET